MRESFLQKLLNKFLFIIIILILNKQHSTAQTVYQGNLYPYQRYTLNSAYAGANEYKSLFLNYKNSSNGIAGSPKQLMFAFSMPVFNKMGLGLRLENYTEGLFGFFTGLIDYSYNVKLNNKQSIRFGISGGLSNRSLDNSKVNATDPSAIAEIASNFFLGPSFESAAGVVYKWANLSVELSAPRLFGTAKVFKPNFSSLVSYDVHALNNQILLHPNVLLMYQPSTPLVYNINLSAEIKKSFVIGIGYRNRPGIVLSAGLLFNEIKLYYAAELGVGNYSNIFNTVHEISVGYTFKKIKKLPVDSSYTPPLELIVKTDSIPVDSTNSLQVLKTDSLNTPNLDTNIAIANERPDTLITITETGQEPELIEIADGIYTIKQENTNATITEGKLDSILYKLHLKNRKRKKDNQDKETIVLKDTTKAKITEISEGIYSVSPEDIIDKKTGKVSEDKIDKVINQMTFNEILEHQEKGTDKSSKFTDEIYYTLLLEMDKNSILLNSNTKISENIRAELSENGKLKYYYGKFSKDNSARQAANQLRKTGYTVLKVVKINASKQP